VALKKAIDDDSRLRPLRLRVEVQNPAEAADARRLPPPAQPREGRRLPAARSRTRRRGLLPARARRHGDEQPRRLSRRDGQRGLLHPRQDVPPAERRRALVPRRGPRRRPHARRRAPRDARRRARIVANHTIDKERTAMLDLLHARTRRGGTSGSSGRGRDGGLAAYRSRIQPSVTSRLLRPALLTKAQSRVGCRPRVPGTTCRGMSGEFASRAGVGTVCAACPVRLRRRAPARFGS